MDDEVVGAVRLIGDGAQAWAAFDRDMRYVAASRKWLADYRLTGPVIGRSHYEVFPEIGEDWKAVHRRCLAGATETRGCDRFERADGSVQWLAWKVRPWRDRHGAIIGIVVFSEPIAALGDARTAPEAAEASEPEEARLSEETAASVGARIESVRRQRDQTRQAFAAVLGVDPETVAAWESGQTIDRKDLNLIAGVTGTSIEWLIAGFLPTEIEAMRTAAFGERSPPRGALQQAADDDRIRSRTVATDHEVARSLSSAWNFQTVRSPACGREARDGNLVRASSRFLHLPGVTLWSGARASGYLLRKGRPPHERAEMSLSVVLRGRRRFEQMGRACEGGPGSAVFALSTEGGRADFDPDGRYLTIFLPMEWMLQRVPQAETGLLQPVAADHSALRPLTAYAEALMKAEAGLGRDLAPAIADHFVDLGALLLGAEGDERRLAETYGLRAAQTSAVREAIDAGAATPGFSILIVAEQLGVSPSRVHDLLEESGVWFSERVDARRVEIVGRRLVDPEFGRMSVEELALACGFTDFDRFDRLFRQRFGDDVSAFRRGPS